MMNGSGEMMGGFFGFGMGGGLLVMAIILLLAGVGVVAIIKQITRN